MRINFNKEYGTYLPVLIKVVNNTDGPILELGMGMYSTPYLHWACKDKERELVSYDLNSEYFKVNKQYESDYHKVFLTEDWDKIEIERLWDIVFIDVSPAEQRKELAKRVARHAKFVILHDSDDNVDKLYRYSEIYNLFKYKYRYNYLAVKPNTVVLSNFVNLNFLNE